MTLLRRFMPNSIEGQMMSVLALSFSLLLLVLALQEVLEYDDLTEWAQSEFTINRLNRVAPVVQSIRAEELNAFLARVSHCHEGYTISSTPYRFSAETEETQAIAAKIAQALSFDPENVRAGYAVLSRADFSYQLCSETEMAFPVQGMVISLETSNGQWLNAEIHPHEWHLTPGFKSWLIRSGTAFFIVALVALLFVRRLIKPIRSLTDGAKKFGEGLQPREIEEQGPPDVRRAIRSFNHMQGEVSDEINRRIHTLAAISHDVRSPLTALRVKAELIEDDEARAELIRSVDKMERITASALEFLKGESRNEPMRQVDLYALIESECAEFKDQGAAVTMDCPESLLLSCRPDALARAIRNLVENAIKYAGSAALEVRARDNQVEIVVSDTGPGIPEDEIAAALEPFARRSDARESANGGFGLGLAIAKAVTEGHDGVFTLEKNSPQGLKAVMRLPR